MPEFEPRDTDFARRIRNSFDRQPFMVQIGARLEHIAPGAVDIGVPNDPGLHQQHGYMHGGVLISIADSAAGFAALSLTPPGTGVLTTELKVNFLRPGGGEAFFARGRVLKPGRTLSVVSCDVFGSPRNDETHLLTGLVTMMHVDGLAD